MTTPLPQVFLVPVDGSPGAEAAVRHAAALAAPLGIPVRLIFVFPRDALDMLGVPPETLSDDQLGSYSPEHFAEVRDRRARHVFERARKAMGEAGVVIEEAVLAGDPAETILDHARRATGPMIIMGSRGLSRFSEMLVGSVSHRVLHHARCPVTIVHR